VTKLIDYKGIAYDDDGKEVQLDGTYEIVEYLPYEPSNYVWQESWIIAEGDTCYTIVVPEIIEWYDKFEPDVSSVKRDFEMEMSGELMHFSDIMLRRFGVYV
jgi:hypothetical protein